MNVYNKIVVPQARQLLRSTSTIRPLATQAKPSKKEGDISSVFVSLSGATASKLPQRFADIKKQLIAGHEEALSASWVRLLNRLASENELVARKGPAIVPQIEFADLSSVKAGDNFVQEVRKRGVAVVRGVVPEQEARSYKDELEEYIRANPWTKGM